MFRFGIQQYRHSTDSVTQTYNIVFTSNKNNAKLGTFTATTGYSTSYGSAWGSCLSDELGWRFGGTYCVPAQHHHDGDSDHSGHEVHNHHYDNNMHHGPRPVPPRDNRDPEMVGVGEHHH